MRFAGSSGHGCINKVLLNQNVVLHQKVVSNHNAVLN